MCSVQTSQTELGILKHVGRSLPGSFEILFGCFTTLQLRDWAIPNPALLHLSHPFFVLVFSSPSSLSFSVFLFFWHSCGDFFFSSLPVSLSLSFSLSRFSSFCCQLGNWEGSSKLAHRWIMHLKQKQRAGVGYICLSESFSVLQLCTEFCWYFRREKETFDALYPSSHLLSRLLLTLLFSGNVSMYGRRTLRITCKSDGDT